MTVCLGLSHIGFETISRNNHVPPLSKVGMCFVIYQFPLGLFCFFFLLKHGNKMDGGIASVYESFIIRGLAKSRVYLKDTF